MYNEFFGLTLLPFNNTPDPRFFFNTPDHEEALASLLYAAEERKGFVLVTGEVGAGKTLLSRMLLSRLSPGSRTAVLNNTRLTGRELLLAICREFELVTEEGATIADISNALEKFLLEQYARDRLAVVVLDEAQNLPNESFEELRMLGNLESDDAKLLQVLILGQPELQDSFRQPSMRQLHQRVFRTFHLKALNRELTEGYIRHRLAVAGMPRGREVFDLEAIDAVYRHSEGIPRLINQICDNALLAAYTESAKEVSVRIVNEVVEQMMALTAGTSEPKPQGAFARQMLGLAAQPSAGERQPAAVSAATLGLGNQQPALGPQPPAPPYHESLQVERYASQARFELEDLRRANREAAELLRDSQAAAKQANDQLHRFLDESRLSSREAGDCIRQLLEEARTITQDVKRQASATLAETQRQNAVLQAKSEHLVKEVHAYTSGEQDRIADLISQDRAEFEAAHQMRKQSAELLKEVSQTAQQANQRIRELLDEAQRSAQSVETQSAETLSETQRQNAALRDQVQQLLEQVRTTTDDHSSRVNELVSQHQAEFTEARQQLATLHDDMKLRAEAFTHRGAEAIGQVREQIRSLSAQFEAQHQRAEARAGDLNTSLDKFLAHLRARVEETQQELTGLVSAAQTEVQTTRDSLQAAKNQILEEAEAARQDVSNVVDQTRELLVKTREQSATLLADLRAQATAQTEKAEKAWQTAVAEGAKTLNDLHAGLAEARMLTDHSRSELESLVKSATNDFAAARSTFEAGLSAHKAEIAKLSGDAAAIRTDVAQRFKDARTDLDAAFAQHQQSLRQRVIHLIGESDGAVSNAEARAKQTVEDLKTGLQTAAETADRIYTDLQDSLSILQRNAAECRTQYDSEATRLQREIGDLVDRNRRLIQETQSQVAAISQDAATTADEFSRRVEDVQRTAKVSVAAIGQELDDNLEKAVRDADKMRSQTETVSAGLAERMNLTRKQAEKAVAAAEKAVAAVREQSKNALATVRGGLAQMCKRSESLQSDLAQMGDEVAESAKTGIRTLNQSATGIIKQIESLREAGERDANNNFRRLDGLRQQVEQGAEQIRHNATKLLDQVQAGAASLREHANELLAQAQSGSDKISEQASALLMQAHNSAERFRQQAEALLRRSEATADAVRRDVQTIRSEILADTQEAREQIAGARQELSQTKSESAEVLACAKSVQEEAQTTSRELLERADQVRTQSEALLNMPRQLVEEANNKAAALAELSSRLSGIVQQLSTAGHDADRKKGELQQVTTSAGDTMELLKRHTARVGQLVGIIRQLYGTMDARIERLRDRLTQADRLARSVPEEIDGLRAALHADLATGTDKARHPASSGDGGAIGEPSGKRPLKTAAKPAASLGGKPVVRPPAAPETTSDKKSLGDIVQGNQRLQKWLRDVLDEADGTVQQPPKPLPNRTSVIPKTPSKT